MRLLKGLIKDTKWFITMEKGEEEEKSSAPGGIQTLNLTSTKGGAISLLTNVAPAEPTYSSS